jgi:hypothetical protein
MPDETRHVEITGSPPDAGRSLEIALNEWPVIASAGAGGTGPQPYMYSLVVRRHADGRHIVHGSHEDRTVLPGGPLRAVELVPADAGGGELCPAVMRAGDALQIPWPDIRECIRGLKLPASISGEYVSQLHELEERYSGPEDEDWDI